MPHPGDDRGACGFGPRPTALPGDRDDRRPMIWDERVQYADRRDRDDQQQLRFGRHQRVPSL